MVEFNRHASACLKVLDDLAPLVATIEELFLQEEIERGVAIQGESERATISSEVRHRYTALAGMSNYPTLLDYAAVDRFELISYHYRPRIEVWIDHMRDNLGGTIDFNFLLQGPYKTIAQSFVDGNYATPAIFPSGQKASDVATSMLADLTTDTNLLVNGDFETGDPNGWTQDSPGATTAAVDTANPCSNDSSFHFDIPSGTFTHYADLAQDGMQVSDPHLYLELYLESWATEGPTTGGTATALVDFYDATDTMKARVYYAWGSGLTNLPTQLPNGTYPFHVLATDMGGNVGACEKLAADIPTEIDTQFGAGTWDSFGITSANFLFQAWSANNTTSAIHGYVDNIELLDGPRTLSYPETPGPTDCEEGVAIDVTLQWDSDTDAEEHEVYFGLAGETLTLRSTQTAETYDPHNDPGVTMAWGTEYQWRIDERVGGSTVVTGNTWDFTTQDLQCDPPLLGDIDGSGDCVVDLADYAVMVSEWMSCNWDRTFLLPCL